MGKKRLCFSYSEETKEDLQKLAKKDKRKLSNYVTQILNSHIKTITLEKRSN